MNVFETLARSARQWPDRTAIIDAGGALDYQSLWREVEALRRQLDRLGVRAGQGIGVRARNGRAFVIGALAALGCGAVIMPIHHQMKPDELADMLAQAPLCAILDDGIGAAQPGKTVALENPGGNGLRFTRLDNSQPPLAPEHRGRRVRAFHFRHHRRRQGRGAHPSRCLGAHARRQCRLGPDAARTKFSGCCRWRIIFTSPSFLYLEIGATVIVSADYLAGSLLETAAKHAATFLYITPMHVRMMNSDQSGRALPPSLKRVMSVSAKLHPQSALDFLAKYQVPVAQGYGIIEVGLPIQNNDEAAEHPEAIGRPVAGFEAKIVDDAMQPLPDGQTGQLALRGPGMFSGYLNPPRVARRDFARRLVSHRRPRASRQRRAHRAWMGAPRR